MSSATKNRFKSRPSFVLDNIYEDYSLDAITKIRKEYLKGDLGKNNAIKDIIALTILKDVKIEQLSIVIKEALKFDEKSAR